MDNKSNLEENQSLAEDSDIKINEPASRGKRILLFLIPILIILLSGLIYFIVSYFRDANTQEVKVEKVNKQLTDNYLYHDFDGILVGLYTADNQRSFLKVSFSIQMSDEATMDALTSKSPIVRDAVQLFLRELRPEELSGTAGVLMIKTEFIKRINKIISPMKIDDILFKELLLSN